jgi:NitT/TauT family transport system substrate-binding protein
MTTRAGRGQAKRALTRIAGFGALVSLAVATTAGAAPASTSQNPPLTKIKVAIIAVEAAAQVMYAKDRGFFRKQGIDAEIVIVADGTLTVPAVLSGQAQFAAVPVAVLAILKSNKAPVKAIAAGAVYEPGTNTSVLVAAPGKRITRARDLVGKRVGLDFLNSIAHIGLLRWLQRGGVSRDDVDITTSPFPQLLGPLTRGGIDAAWLPEPYATLAIQRGAKRFATPFDATCSEVCLLTAYMARSSVDPNLAARFRNAVQAAALWANQKRNQPTSARILARYTGVDAKVIARTARFSYATRLRVRMAQPFLDLYAEYDLIPDSFRAIDLVK